MLVSASQWNARKVKGRGEKNAGKARASLKHVFQSPLVCQKSRAETFSTAKAGVAGPIHANVSEWV